MRPGRDPGTLLRAVSGDCQSALVLNDFRCVAGLFPRARAVRVQDPGCGSEARFAVEFDVGRDGVALEASASEFPESGKACPGA